MSNKTTMRVRLTLTTESGEVFEGDTDLTRRDKGVAPRKVKHGKVSEGRPLGHSAARKSTGGTPDISMPLRPFLRQQVRGKSGAAKVTLVIAHLARGNTGVEVDSGEVQKAWNRATAFLGEYNRAHATRAKDYGWIDSPKHGVYKLRDSWVNAG